MFGLASSLISGIYAGAFHNTELASFQLTMSILTLVVAWAAAILLYPVTMNEGEQNIGKSCYKKKWERRGGRGRKTKTDERKNFKRWMRCAFFFFVSLFFRPLYLKNFFVSFVPLVWLLQALLVFLLLLLFVGEFEN